MGLHEEIEDYKTKFVTKAQLGYLITEVNAKHFEYSFYEPIIPFSEIINHNHVPEEVLDSLDSLAKEYNLSESFKEKFTIAKKAKSKIEETVKTLR